MARIDRIKTSDDVTQQVAERRKMNKKHTKVNMLSNVTDLLATFPSILAEASRTRMGVVCLIALLISIVCIVLFYDAPHYIRLTSFVLLILSLLVFGIMVIITCSEKQDRPEHMKKCK